MNLLKKLKQYFGKSESNYLAANAKILEYHKKVNIFSVVVNKKIYEKHNNKHPYPTAEGALHKITADIFSLHCSVLCLCEGGWALASPVLLRTMMELLLSIKIIVNKTNDSEYFAFKYMYSFCREIIRNNNDDEHVIKVNVKNIEIGLSKLNDTTRKRAKEFLDEQRMGKYWYNPEYTSLRNVIDKFGSKRMKDMYKIYSGTTHGGYLGLNIFKGQPDNIHPNPRADKRSQNLALAHSSRILLDSMYSCGIFNGLELENVYQELITELIDLRKVIESL